MTYKVIKTLLLTGSLIFVACQPRYWTMQQRAYAVTNVVADSSGVDSAMVALIGPYKDSIQRLVDEVIGISSFEMKKKLPTSTLGNLLADLLFEKVNGHFGQVDFAMLNYGGIRAALPADSIRRGHLMEILPFQNYVAVVEMDGRLVQQFLDHWARKGGTPVAAVEFTISEGKALDILIQNEPIDTLRQYRVAMPDYVANGGDGCAFLQAAHNIDVRSLLLFDVIFEAFKEAYQAGRPIEAKEDGRVCYK